MSEEDTSNRVSLSIADLTSQTTASTAGDSEKALTELKKQIVALQSENASLKRQMPRMKDMQGNDHTEQMKQLCEDLAKAEQSNEQWQNMYAESEQNFSRFQRKTNSELDARDTQISQLKTRAKALEEENEKLKKQAENDQSKIFHLQNDADTSEQHNLSLGEFERSYECDITSQIRQELAEKTEENAKLSQQLEQTILLVENLKKTIERQAESLKRVADLENDSIFALPKLDGDLDNAVANVLLILQQLDNNKRDTNNLRDEIINFMRNQGYPIDAKNIAEISKELETTFRTKFNSRRNQIKKNNDELAEEYRFENTELARQLNQLSDDSIFSSIAAASAQQIGDPQTSFAVDLGRSIVGVDMLNRTVDVAQDLGTVVSKMNGLRSICNQLFEKLRGTAEFLQNLLNNLEDSEEGRELLRKINEIKLDLDKSMHEARNLVDEVKKAEKSVSDFRGMLQQTINQTSEDYSQFQTDITQDSSADTDLNEAMKQELERLKSVEVQYESLKISLNNELAIKEGLNNKLLDYKRHLENVEMNFNNDIQTLNSEIEEHKQQASQLHNDLQEREQVIEKMECNLKEKDNELTEAESRIQRLKTMLSESAEAIKNTRAEFNQLTSKYDSSNKALNEHRTQLDEKLCINAELEDEISTLKTENENLLKQVEAAEAKVFSLRQENSTLGHENACFAKKLQDLNTQCTEREVLVAKSNEVLYEKITKNIEEAGLDNTFTEDPQDEESISDFDHFSKFLSDCNERSNKLVQIVKKAESVMAENGSKLPYLQNLLNEARAIRLMLHRISKFFESQKENLSNTNKKLGRAIRAELKKIYDTLESAAQTSHSTVSAIRANAAAQPK